MFGCVGRRDSDLMQGETMTERAKNRHRRNKRKGRATWKVMIVVGLMLLAMFVYLASMDEADPGAILDDPSIDQQSAPVSAMDAAE